MYLACVEWSVEESEDVGFWIVGVCMGVEGGWRGDGKDDSMRGGRRSEIFDFACIHLLVIHRMVKASTKANLVLEAKRTWSVHAGLE